MTYLSVNLNKMALIRNSRPGGAPDLSVMAARCLRAGAKGVTIHPRPDQRHARYSDARALREVCDTFPGTELNIEGNPIREFLDVVLEARPDQCTLVPDTPGQLTSDHGWDVALHAQTLQEICRELKAAGIRSSIFLDPSLAQIQRAADTGADRIELYTQPYAHAFGTAEQETVLVQYVEAAAVAQRAGLGVNAGHDLNLANVGALCARAMIAEVSIGHALTVEAFDYGLEGTITRYLAALGK